MPGRCVDRGCAARAAWDARAAYAVFAARAAFLARAAQATRAAWAVALLPAAPVAAVAAPAPPLPVASSTAAPTAPPAAPPAVQPAGADCAWPVADSVEALLQAETQAALRARRGLPGSPVYESPYAASPLGPAFGPVPAGGPGVPGRAGEFAASGAWARQADTHAHAFQGGSPAPGQRPADRVAVAAIYGVGRRLHVDVRINGQLARYRQGRRWPEHAPRGGAGVYALAAVLGECVRLQGGEGARLACLDAAAPMERGH